MYKGIKQDKAVSQIPPAEEEHNYEPMSPMNIEEVNKPTATSKSRWIIVINIICIFFAVTALTVGIIAIVVTTKNKQMESDIQAQLLETQSINDVLTARLNTIQNDTDTRITAIETKSQLAGESAFMAVMTVGDFRPTQFQVIPFNTAPVNPGSHYNTSSYVYTCPQHGLFIFSFSIYSYPIGGTYDNDHLSGRLMLDGEAVAEVFSRNGDPDHLQDHQAATTAVVDCPANGTVWVETRYSGVRIGGTASSPWSVFTGYAIRFY